MARVLWASVSTNTEVYIYSHPALISLHPQLPCQASHHVKYIA
jgi:hypothetical protein